MRGRKPGSDGLDWREDGIIRAPKTEETSLETTDPRIVLADQEDVESSKFDIDNSEEHIRDLIGTTPHESAYMYKAVDEFFESCREIINQRMQAKRRAHVLAESFQKTKDHLEDYNEIVKNRAVDRLPVLAPSKRSGQNIDDLLITESDDQFSAGLRSELSSQAKGARITRPLTKVIHALRKHAEEILRLKVGNNPEALTAFNIDADRRGPSRRRKSQKRDVGVDAIIEQKLLPVAVSTKPDFPGHVSRRKPRERDKGVTSAGEDRQLPVLVPQKPGFPGYVSRPDEASTRHIDPLLPTPAVIGRDGGGEEKGVHQESYFETDGMDSPPVDERQKMKERLADLAKRIRSHGNRELDSALYREILKTVEEFLRSEELLNANLEIPPELMPWFVIDDELERVYEAMKEKNKRLGEIKSEIRELLKDETQYRNVDKFYVAQIRMRSLVSNLLADLSILKNQAQFFIDVERAQEIYQMQLFECQKIIREVVQGGFDLVTIFEDSDPVGVPDNLLTDISIPQAEKHARILEDRVGVGSSFALEKRKATLGTDFYPEHDIDSYLDTVAELQSELSLLLKKSELDLRDLNRIHEILKAEKGLIERGNSEMKQVEDKEVKLRLEGRLGVHIEAGARLFHEFTDSGKWEQVFPESKQAFTKCEQHLGSLEQSFLEVGANPDQIFSVLDTDPINVFQRVFDLFEDLSAAPGKVDSNELSLLAHRIAKVFETYQQHRLLGVLVLPKAVTDLFNREQLEIDQMLQEHTERARHVMHLRRLRKDIARVESELEHWSATYLSSDFTPQYEGQKHPSVYYRDAYRREIQRLIDMLAEGLQIQRLLARDDDDIDSLEGALKKCQTLINTATNCGVDLKTYLPGEQLPVALPPELKRLIKMADAKYIETRAKNSVSVEQLRKDLEPDLLRLTEFLETMKLNTPTPAYGEAREVFNEMVNRLKQDELLLHLDDKDKKTDYRRLIEEIESLRTQLSAHLSGLPRLTTDLRMLIWNRKLHPMEYGDDEVTARHPVFDDSEVVEQTSIDQNQEGIPKNVIPFPGKNTNVQSPPSRRGILRLAAAALATIGLGGLFPWSRDPDQPSKVSVAARNFARFRPVRSSRSPEVTNSIELDPGSTLLEEMRVQGATVTKEDLEKFRQAGATVREGTESEPLQHEGITYILKRVILHDPGSYGLKTGRTNSGLDDRAAKLAIRLTKRAGLMDKWLTQKAADDKLMIFPLRTSDDKWEIASAQGNSLIALDALEDLGYLENAPSKN